MVRVGQAWDVNLTRESKVSPETVP
ncbi:hypothetical protein PSCLAVI8L_130367 [Pseudoclavibacter sp. 8L]|nr:hypothetical protein PSCLAVI8L_130367 [Pseudoclavibacter sp. 8L]